jgi:hypothetical protein
MKRWIMLTAALLAFQAEAEIYKCSDAEGKITYQGAPCQSRTVGKVKEAPAVPEEDRKLAQGRLDRMIEMNRQRDIVREQEWQKQQEEARRIAEEEERARQQAERERLARLEQERRERYYWYPWLPRWPWWGSRPPQPPRHATHSGEQTPRKPPDCRPGSGDRSRCD